jgi:hypothetical protein
MDRTLTNSAEDWAIDDRGPPAAMQQVRRRRHIIIALRSVFALALLALALVALNRFDEDISYCVANWVLHPRTACWASIYDY